MSFVHLHNRTQYSLLDGAMSPGQLVSKAVEFEMPAVAITDTCNLYCAVEFYKKTKGTPVKAIYGSEIWLWPEGLEELKSDSPDHGWHLNLLVENKEGYHNLCALMTRAIFEGMHYRPRIDLDMLKQHHKGLIALTSGLNGPVGTALNHREHEVVANERLQELRSIFGDENLFIELQDYGIAQQREMNQLSRQLSSELGLQTVVTNDCRYLRPEDAVTLDLLNCVAKGHNFDSPDRLGIETDQQYFKTESEMRMVFPNDSEALENTVKIAERCHYKFITDTYWFPATDPPDPNPTAPEGVGMEDKTYRSDTQANWAYFYRAYPPPKSFEMPHPDVEIPPAPKGAGNMCGYFEWYCHKGLELRLERVDPAIHDSYRERLEVEIEIIESMGFPAYMLIVAEFINWSKDNDIPVGPGRGSAAGSLVSYSMGITDIDPMRYSLLFERFLNPERVSMPDIDVDFCQDRREEAIQHVREKYGSDMVSQIITYGKLQAKAAIKDVARALGLDFNASNDIAKLVPDILNIKLKDALADPKLMAFSSTDPLVNRVMTLACRVEGMTRQTGVHAAGVVIADRPMVEHAPLYRDGPEGGPVVQYDMKSSESIGLIKFDFLGLKTLDVIRDAVKMIARNTGELIDISNIDVQDSAVYEMLSRGDGLGVFQVESAGMRKLLTRLKPSSIDDLIALIALFRPGPLSSGMVDTFIDCKHGRQAVKYPHDSLEPILKSTYGSIVYQEQVMQIAQEMASYSLGEADLLRRAMGKKKAEEMEKQKVRFVRGAKDNGITEEKAVEVFDLMAYFAGYGFNKSHSAAYGMVCYQTAYLKAHHRAEFMASLMSIEANNSDKILMYIGDCRKARIVVLPPDVNESELSFEVQASKRNQIRYGLEAIKGVGAGAVKSIIEVRDSHGGRFKDLMHFFECIDYRKVNKKVLEGLIKCGAMDWTGHPRQEMLEGLSLAISEGQRIQRDKAAGQRSLFGLSAAMKPPDLQLPNLGEWPIAQKLKNEHSVLGLFITGHPLDAFVDVEEKNNFTPILTLDSMRAGAEVTVAGVVVSAPFRRTKTGKSMCIVQLEGRDDAVECTFFSDALEASASKLKVGAMLSIAGKVERRGDSVSIMAKAATELLEKRDHQTRRVLLKFGLNELTSDILTKLNALIDESPGSCSLSVELDIPEDGVAVLQGTRTISPSESFLEQLEVLFRRHDVARLM